MRGIMKLKSHIRTVNVSNQRHTSVLPPLPNTPSPLSGTNPTSQFRTPHRKQKKTSTSKGNLAQGSAAALRVVLTRRSTPMYAGRDREMEALLRDIEDQEARIPLARSQSETHSNKKTRLKQWGKHRKSVGVIPATRQSPALKHRSLVPKRPVQTPDFLLRAQPDSTKARFRREHSTEPVLKLRKTEALSPIQHTRSSKIRLFVSYTIICKDRNLSKRVSVSIPAEE